MARDPQRRS
jgi:hypothetical protein